MTRMVLSVNFATNKMDFANVVLDFTENVVIKVRKLKSYLQILGIYEAVNFNKYKSYCAKI